ncbi:TetR/AcrR family transcriptional regulator [Kribbella sp. NPDC051936]|uniref:TetR/AcrR family transcriptional regulator n=1 Tax=Kribbella sp. NPDC051936 TaxID=3154946 RepID=UPI00342A6C2B
MPKVSADYKAEQRLHLIRAAGRRITDVGFQKLVMLDVVEESGMSSGGIYGYFASKEELVAAVTKDVMRQLEVLLRRTLTSSPKPTVDALFGALLNEVEVLEQGGTRVSQLAVHVWAEATHDEGVRSLVMDSLHTARKLLADAVRKARKDRIVDRTATPDGVADTLLGLLMGYMMQRCVLDDVSPSGHLAGLQALTGTAKERVRLGPA